MQEWLDNNNILMCSIHNEGKSVIAERFIKTLKSEIYKRMTSNDSKSYLPYLNLFLIGILINTIILIIILLTKNLFMLIILLRLKTLSQIVNLLNLK